VIKKGACSLISDSVPEREKEVPLVPAEREEN